MRLEAPGRLALIFAPLALVVAYVIIQRGRHKYTTRFTSADLLTSVARRPSWQPHISATVLLLALVALVVGLAAQRRLEGTRKHGTVLLTIDTSGSMNTADVAPTRLRAAQAPAGSSHNSRRACGSVHLVQRHRTRSSHHRRSPTSPAAINGLQLGSGATPTPSPKRAAVRPSPWMRAVRRRWRSR
jgi:hypothetical protein